MRGLLHRSRVWVLTVGMAGGVFVLESCDATVRDTVLTGVGSAATGLASTFIQAFIQSLQAQDQTTTTMRVNLHDLPPLA